MKTAAVVLILLGLVVPNASAQGCTTPVVSWTGTYTLSGSGSVSCVGPIGTDGTCSFNQSVTAQPLFGNPVVESCTAALWPSRSDSITSISVSDVGTWPCPPSDSLTETLSGTGTGRSSSTLNFDLSNNTYNLNAQPFANITEVISGCTSGSGPGMPGIYPVSNWPQTFSLPATVQPLTVDNSNFQGLNLLFGTGVSIPWTGSFSLRPNYDCDACRQKGSDGLPVNSSIAIENGSLGEDVPIVGTGLNLHYESSRLSSGSATAFADAAALGGWTLNVHHAFDPTSSTLLLGDGTERHAYELGAPVVLNGNVLFTAEDAEEVYVFSLTTGQHTETLAPLTGALIYAFGYDAAGKLVTVTDGSGNVSTIQRDTSEQATAIVSPFGQTTSLGVDVYGFLNQVTDPLGHTQTFINGSTGLLTSRTDQNGNVFNYSYDANGRLTKDADPLGGFVSTGRTDAPSGFGWAIAEATSMGRTSSYQTTMALPWLLSSTSSVSEEHANVLSDGLPRSWRRSLGSGQLTEGLTLPDGTTENETLGADPRWGLQAPVPSSGTVTQGTLNMTTTGLRTATLGIAGDPFSLTSQTDKYTENGRAYSAVFTTSDHSYVFTTPANRRTTEILDALERPSSVQVGTLLPIAFAYDSQGHLSTVTQGTRKTTLSYDTSGFLSSITDPLGQQTYFAYDANGRLVTRTLADGRTIGYAYDANGNVTSVTPPGRSTHQFAYNAADLVTSYTPPTVADTGPTTYAYDLDRALTSVTRPDSQTIAYAYDAAGRLSSVTTPTERINSVYDGVTGNLDAESIASGESLAYGYNGPLLTAAASSGSVAGTVSRTFNDNFWVASESLNGSNTVDFTYDKDGLLTKAGSLVLKYNSNGLLTGTTLGNAVDSRGHNAFGELTSYTASYKAGRRQFCTKRCTPVMPTGG